MIFEVFETAHFRAALEDALFWLYSHNIEQSQEIADRKFYELEQEIHELKTHLKRTPGMGQADAISGLRCFPLYDGRYLATWMTNETAKTVTLLEFLDLKYPQHLREFHTED